MEVSLSLTGRRKKFSQAWKGERFLLPAVRERRREERPEKAIRGRKALKRERRRDRKIEHNASTGDQ